MEFSFCYKPYILFVFLLFYLSGLHAQNGSIKGIVSDELTNKSLAFANVLIEELGVGTTTNEDGSFEIGGLSAGTYNIKISYIGYEPKIIFELNIPSNGSVYREISLREGTSLDEVVVKVSPFDKSLSSPVSLKNISTTEIERNPGGNRDISKVIQSFPGVASAISWRNDLIIRGGAPNENRFFMDGIEFPNINHFATQGTSGGVYGMINTQYIKNVEMYSGAFPANRGNMLSSVFEFSQKDGNPDRMKFSGVVGLTDLSAMIDGPIGKKTNYLLSVRYADWGLIGESLGFAALPKFADYQFRLKHKFSAKNELLITGLGAYDVVTTNEDAIDGSLVSDQDDKELVSTFIDQLSDNTQNNFTIGLRYRHFTDIGNHAFYLSGSLFNNKLENYQKFREDEEELPFQDYFSEEIESKFRYEFTGIIGDGYRINIGLGLENASIETRNNNTIATSTEIIERNYFSDISFLKYSTFASIGKEYLNDRIKVSLGMRIDGSDYSEEMENPFSQFSPRFSLSYALNDQISFNANTGIYYQLPPYTSMGYLENGELVNTNTGLKYSRSNHFIAGFDYVTSNNLKLSIEGFYKDYDQMPLLVRENVPLANFGANFGVIGIGEVNSDAEGRSYGFEFMAHQKLFKNFYGILSYTYMHSGYRIKGTDDYIPSSWDYRHIGVLTIGRKFKRNWEIGIKFRGASGGPYTPIDLALSSIKENYDINPAGILDYDKLNTERQDPYFQMDIRIDKKYFFKKWSLNWFLDIQNLTNSTLTQPPLLVLARDNNNNPITAPNDSSRYQARLGTFEPPVNIFPTIGIIFER